MRADSRWSVSLVGAVITLSVTQRQAPAQSVLAFDCETNTIPNCGGFGFPCETFRELRDGLDINDGGCVVFADKNGVYVVNAAGGKTVCPYTGVVVQRGAVVGPNNQRLSETFGASSDGSLQRINENGCVVFIGQRAPNACLPLLPLLSCGESEPGDCIEISDLPQIVVRGRTGGTDCRRTVLYGYSGPFIEDLDILETKAPIPIYVPPPLEYRAIAALASTDQSEPNRIVYLGPSAQQVVTYSDAHENGIAPNGTPYEENFFDSVTSGDSQPVAFSARLETVHNTVSSELHQSLVECDAIPGFFIGNHVVSRIDLGCVECFGTNQTSVVQIVAKDTTNVCSGAGGFVALVESDMDPASGTAAETRVLLDLGQYPPGVDQSEYKTLGCGRVCGIGGDPDRVSASEVPLLPPRCGRCTVELGGCSEATGVAVFKGDFGAPGQSCVEAIFVCTAPRRVYVLAKEGDAVPGHLGTVFESFGDPRVNAAGVVVFWAATSAQCQVLPPPANTVNCGGIFRYDLNTFLAGVDPNPCPWDLDRDGDVSDTDEEVFLDVLWGTNEPCADFNGDGTVGIGDWLILLNNWGPCCP